MHGVEGSCDVSAGKGGGRKVGFEVPEVGVRGHIVRSDTAQGANGDEQQGKGDELSVGGKRVGLAVGLVAGFDSTNGSVLPPRAPAKRKLAPDDAHDGGAPAQEMARTDDDGKEGEDEPEDVGVAVRGGAHLVDGEVRLDPVVAVNESRGRRIGFSVCIMGSARGVGWLCPGSTSRKGRAVARDDRRGLRGVYVRKRH